MQRRDRIRDRYPIFSAYGGEHEFLTTEAAIAATPEARIRSIWPFIVRRVIKFQESLKHRERANFDHEDTLTELWVALAEKDSEWSPDRGKYITFAGVIIDCELCAIRDKARTVHSPRNSSCRLKKYRAEEQSGTISGRRLKTANDIRRTSDGIGPISPGHSREATSIGVIHHDPAVVLAGREATEETIDALKVAIKATLTPFEASVLGRLAGLWGRTPQTVWQMAWETGHDQGDIRRAKSRAFAKVRRHLLSIRHPATVDAKH